MEFLFPLPSVFLKSVYLFCRDFQGTSMEGPIPPNISLLKKLEELWAEVPYLVASRSVLNFLPSCFWLSLYMMRKLIFFISRCLVFAGEYLIWMDRVQLSLICRIWTIWQYCELNETDQIYCLSLSNRFCVPSDNNELEIDNIFLSQDSEELLNDWYNPRVHWRYGIAEYSVSFSIRYLDGKA